jgi:hypothetical protein
MANHVMGMLGKVSGVSISKVIVHIMIVAVDKA